MGAYLRKPLMNCVLRQARSLSNALKSYFEAPEYLAQNFFELLTSQSLPKVSEPSRDGHLILRSWGLSNEVFLLTFDHLTSSELVKLLKNYSKLRALSSQLKAQSSQTRAQV